MRYYCNACVEHSVCVFSPGTVHLPCPSIPPTPVKLFVECPLFVLRVSRLSPLTFQPSASLPSTGALNYVRASGIQIVWILAMTWTQLITSPCSAPNKPSCLDLPLLALLGRTLSLFPIMAFELYEKLQVTGQNSISMLYPDPCPLENHSQTDAMQGKLLWLFV